jgi:hypothetical protein
MFSISREQILAMRHILKEKELRSGRFLGCGFAIRTEKLTKFVNHLQTFFAAPGCE